MAGCRPTLNSVNFLEKLVAWAVFFTQVSVRRSGLVVAYFDELSPRNTGYCETRQFVGIMLT